MYMLRKGQLKGERGQAPSAAQQFYYLAVQSVRPPRQFRPRSLLRQCLRQYFESAGLAQSR